jgi:hypothetical protein
MAEPWERAYKKQFGHDPSEDMAASADDVEAWRINWQSGYDAGEDWATSMAEGDE